MGFRYRRRISILPFLKLNLGKRGFSFNFGGRWLSLNFGKKGIFGNMNLPIKGLSYRKQLYKRGDDGGVVGRRPPAPPK